MPSTNALKSPQTARDFQMRISTHARVRFQIARFHPSKLATAASSGTSSQGTSDNALRKVLQQSPAQMITWRIMSSDLRKGPARCVSRKIAFPILGDPVQTPLENLLRP